MLLCGLPLIKPQYPSLKHSKEKPGLEIRKNTVKKKSGNLEHGPEHRWSSRGNRNHRNPDYGAVCPAVGAQQIQTPTDRSTAATTDGREMFQRKRGKQKEPRRYWTFPASHWLHEAWNRGRGDALEKAMILRLQRWLRQGRRRSAIQVALGKCFKNSILSLSVFLSKLETRVHYVSISFSIFTTPYTLINYGKMVLRNIKGHKKAFRLPFIVFTWYEFSLNGLFHRHTLRYKMKETCTYD